ncbi:Mediator of RNA polymerase II transcription subunit 11 [Halotydeus destructor]|nr:Mediator of RNA polymerase II transcription subunit 11 [Halotydeus destructor]
MERLRQLEHSEKQLLTAVHALGLGLQELSKEKPTIKLVENHTATFVNSLQSVEANLSRQLNYLSQVSTGQSHEGSAYGSQKVLDMAVHRLEHSKSRLKELDRMKAHHMHEMQLANQRRFSQVPNHDMSQRQRDMNMDMS